MKIQVAERIVDTDLLEAKWGRGPLDEYPVDLEAYDRWRNARAAEFEAQYDRWRNARGMKDVTE